VNSILRVLRGNWLVVAVCAAASLLGGILVILLSPPRYAATARVALDYIKPDPITGSVVHSKAVDVYLASQLRLLRDVQVAVPAAESLGWLDNPDVQAAYAAQPGGDGRDFEAWVASILINGTNVRMVEGSNIMEISYTTSSQELAVDGVEALRQAYISSGITAKRESARAAAAALAARADRVRADMLKLQATQSKLEDESGLVLGANGNDVEALRLRNIARAQPTAVFARETRLAPSAAALAALDAQIAATSKDLGVNHPRLRELRGRRETLAAQVAAENAVVAAEGSTADLANSVSAELLEQQKERVLSKRIPSTELRLMQDEIEHRTEELNNLTQAVVQNRQVALATTSTMTPVGPPTPAVHAVFPNKPLILGASLAAGLILGVLSALLIELNARRIRSVKDLTIATGGPVLAVLPSFKPAAPTVGRRRRGRTPAPVGVEVPAE
jgi:succinoglycan biosynthesis transport protein ExoP